MRVLLLTPLPHYLADPLTEAGDRFCVSEDTPDKWPEDIDFIVSFGYRHVISERVIDRHRGRLINIHISLLPWNRGADPNFWSWFDRTPKGVSIHAIDPGIDTGDVLAQIEAPFEGREDKLTLRSSYSDLVRGASILFDEFWPILRTCDWSLIEAPKSNGSYHRAGELTPWLNKLPLGWDTPVKDVEELGSASKDN